MANFDLALPIILREEGGAVNNPMDPGGPTAFGITNVTAAAWLRSHGKPVRPAKTLSPDEVKTIYKEVFWDPFHLDEPGISQAWGLVVFDSTVNLNPRSAIRIVQGSLMKAERYTGKLDGIFGPVTRAACTGDAYALDALQARVGYHVAQTDASDLAGILGNRLHKLTEQLQSLHAAVKLAAGLR